VYDLVDSISEDDPGNEMTPHAADMQHLKLPCYSMTEMYTAVVVCASLTIYRIKRKRSSC